MKKIIQDLTFEQVQNKVISLGGQPFRARQLFDGLTRGKNISEINIDPALRQKLCEEFEDETLKIENSFSSSDGCTKYLFRLADGNLIEGVLMPYKYGNTQCVSTQVGCRMGCKFCASTLGGLCRNLSSGEMLSQVLKINSIHLKGSKRGVTNVVLMGSGEPLDNYAQTVAFLRAVTSPQGINISARNISLSTCGLVSEIYALADEGLPINLTVSLHHHSDEGRQRLMPIAKKYTIAQILKACEYYFEKTGRRYIFEYSLIRGENASKADAAALVELLKGKPCHVNLIRLNEVKERDLSGVEQKEAYAFLGLLQKGGLSATLRRSLGSDIGGACGQLRASYLKNQSEVNDD